MVCVIVVQCGMVEWLQGKVGIIGVGGILEGDDVVIKFDVGVLLVQIYFGLIYCGLVLIVECVEEICCQCGVVDVC